MREVLKKVTEKLSPLQLRVVSAAVLAPAVIALIVIGSWPFTTLILASAILAFHEWKAFSNKAQRPLATMITGCVYISLTFASYVFLRMGFQQGAWLAICFMVAVWASDSGAYFIGRAVGGPKLAPAISPKKTWAGFWGAVFSYAIALLLLTAISPYIGSWIDTDIGVRKTRHVWGIFLTGLFFGGLAQAGDLFISYFKRRAGIKDSGQVIPGHGGLLDRIDSGMLVSPFFLLAAILWLG